MVHLSHMTVCRNYLVCSASGLYSKDGHCLRNISRKSRSIGMIATGGLGFALRRFPGERVAPAIDMKRLEGHLNEVAASARLVWNTRFSPPADVA